MSRSLSLVAFFGILSSCGGSQEKYENSSAKQLPPGQDFYCVDEEGLDYHIQSVKYYCDAIKKDIKECGRESLFREVTSRNQQVSIKRASIEWPVCNPLDGVFPKDWKSGTPKFQRLSEFIPSGWF